VLKGNENGVAKLKKKNPSIDGKYLNEHYE